MHLSRTVWREILCDMEFSTHHLAGVTHGAASAEECARQLDVAESAGCLALALHFLLQI